MSDQVFTNKGLNISWTKFGMAFGWEIAAICSLQKEIEPPITDEGALVRRWREIFPNSPAVPPMANAGA